MNNKYRMTEDTVADRLNTKANNIKKREEDIKTLVEDIKSMTLNTKFITDINVFAEAIEDACADDLKAGNYSSSIKIAAKIDNKTNTTYILGNKTDKSQLEDIELSDEEKEIIQKAINERYTESIIEIMTNQGLAVRQESDNIININWSKESIGEQLYNEIRKEITGWVDIQYSNNGECSDGSQAVEVTLFNVEEDASDYELDLNLIATDTDIYGDLALYKMDDRTAYDVRTAVKGIQDAVRQLKEIGSTFKKYGLDIEGCVKDLKATNKLEISEVK